MSFLTKLANRTKEVAEKTAAATIEAFEGMKVDATVREERYDICKACPHFISTTTTCTKCGCFMAAKTHLANAKCPIDKWQPVVLVSSKSQI